MNHQRHSNHHQRMKPWEISEGNHRSKAETEGSLIIALVDNTNFPPCSIIAFYKRTIWSLFVQDLHKKNTCMFVTYDLLCTTCTHPCYTHCCSVVDEVLVNQRVLRWGLWELCCIPQSIACGHVEWLLRFYLYFYCTNFFISSKPCIAKCVNLYHKVLLILLNSKLILS